MEENNTMNITVQKRQEEPTTEPQQLLREAAENCPENILEDEQGREQYLATLTEAYQMTERGGTRLDLQKGEVLYMAWVKLKDEECHWTQWVKEDLALAVRTAQRYRDTYAFYIKDRPSELPEMETDYLCRVGTTKLDLVRAIYSMDASFLEKARISKPRFGPSSIRLKAIYDNGEMIEADATAPQVTVAFLNECLKKIRCQDDGTRNSTSSTHSKKQLKEEKEALERQLQEREESYRAMVRERDEARTEAQKLRKQVAELEAELKRLKSSTTDEEN